jgi:hypothetical protein
MQIDRGFCMKWDETGKVKMKLTIKRSIDGRMRRNGGEGIASAMHRSTCDHKEASDSKEKRYKT